MTETQENQATKETNFFRPYDLDYEAQLLVLKYRDKKNVLNESHKMRMAVAYGLERFWGEHLRLKRDKDSKEKGAYWKDVWDNLVKILDDAGVKLPNDDVKSTLPDRTREEKEKKEADETKKIQGMAKKIWEIPLPDQRIALMVLTQFCEALVWWTQRYKKKENNNS
ncbi:MAG TPA: hypothetical protein DEG17_07245 [Cyanobacteria bacterium UBA11149]|nr:hypothetical protein [Cyanobacteria bacterium UBA11367]HBE59461.1 hypothetical protein [Cyanobacteria bacterium UBA11366]HBK65313.1 hypothetical protein [Cyanobacteria bacterium UBA11166]HBR75189.1 hypothetical protein [Cyanobacteria bacterium UBA11159]HBS68825.1 hypothetical protein [Cyanobacteria bacterium UBA11153]HBW88660.1 hypothetical protein [Cyanobacteria bacterium UBA11149]HCA97850.1 hypothetical protein [Cyanobacteria bacterium UBA9226]